MKKIWTYRDVDAPADVVWSVFTNPAHWPEWGPSIRSAELDDAPMQLGTRGTVTIVVGARLGFEITRYDEGARWAWKVAGIDATDHTVEALGDDRSRVGFGVPWVVAPYQAICWLALHRIKTIAESTEVTV